MHKILISIISIIVLSYFGLGAFLYIMQRNFMYFPTPVIQQPFGKNEVFELGVEKINTIVINEGKQKAIIYFGGNGEAVAYNAQSFSEIFPNYTVYLVNYRGYGLSTGQPSELALYADAITIFESLETRYQSVSVLGRSLGSGVASYVASKKPVEKLVLITPFDSIQKVAQRTYPMFPMSILLKDKYDSVGRAASIKAKTLLVVAESDRLITRPHSDALFDALPKSQTQQTIIKGVGHNSISNAEAYYLSLGTFINEL